MLTKDSKIYIAGHKGLVGSAICRCLKKNGYKNILVKTHTELPLENEKLVEKFFREEKPSHVILAAAKVGGIMANIRYGADFIRENIRIQTNVIDCSYRWGTEKLIFLGSSCIYPKFAPQPIKETSLLSGNLEESNLPYAIAKISGKVMCDAYKSQYNFNAFTVMPSNVYGIGDNFDPENSHVVAGMMRRFHEAKINQNPEVIVWGSGEPLRELIFSDDLAEGCLLLLKKHEKGGMVNLGSSQEISIKELAKNIAKVTGYKGKIQFDTTKPDGTPRKIMDNKIINQYGWQARTSIFSGLEQMYKWWLLKQ